jgi:hypothetical protein
MSRLTPRKGMPSPRLNEGEFRKRFLAQFQDRAFDSLASELDSIATAAWDAYSHSRKAPRTRKAGAEFADPDYDLSVDWLAARAAIAAAQRRHDDRSKPAILLINCSSRSEHTCPGEMSKSYRLVEIAREVFAAAPSVAIELLDLSRLASEYGRHIYPCKACLLHGRRPLPLAVLMLSELFTRSDTRLDERDLPDVGCGPRHHDCYARELVSSLIAAQADDGPSRLRGWRQSGSHAHAGQERGAGEANRT